MNEHSNTRTYPKGSEWRKWDLQVHTPFSALNNGFGSDFEAYAVNLFRKACSEDVDVIAVGVTDYFTIEGYKELRKLLNDKAKMERILGEELCAKIDQILFIPNVELRSSTIIVDPKGQDSRVNFHVLFSDAVATDDIEEQFLHELKFTADANPDSQDERWPLKTRHLIELGRRLKVQHERFQMYSDLYVGMLNAVIDHSEASKVLENKQSVFKDKYLLCLPCDEDLSKCSWNGQGHLSRKVLIQKSHLLISSNANTRAFGLGEKHSSLEAYKAEFKGMKPCVHSSDSHTFDELFLPDKKRHTWIKADPTFHGLRQILSEPEHRVSIGELPPNHARITKRATRIMESVEVRKLAQAATSEKWFDFRLSLNSELVAVIGNKGSGKSALSDILGLLGNTPRYDSFSFLCPKRFRDPKNNKAQHFQATLTWADGTVDNPQRLDTNPPTGAVERVKYIPQNYLEEICNELGNGSESKFNQELKEVIFSHVSPVDRLGFGTLDELLAHRTHETTQAIQQLVQELRECNELIVAAEKEMLPSNGKALEGQLAERRRELNAHLQRRPHDVTKPSEDAEVQSQSKVTEDLLSQKNKGFRLLEAEMTNLRADDALAAKRLSTAEKLTGKLGNLKHQVEIFTTEAQPESEELGIPLDRLVTFSVDASPLSSLVQALALQRASTARKLDQRVEDSPAWKRERLLTEIAAIQAKLSAPQKAYQTHLEAIKEWENEHIIIVGSQTSVGSIKYFEALLSKLDALPKHLKALQKRRMRKLLAIFQEKQKLRDYYKIYYGGVQKFLQSHPLASSGSFELTFSVLIEEEGFVEAFFSRIDRRRVGPFMGEEDGRAEIKKLLAKATFGSGLGTLRFVVKLFKTMQHRGAQKLFISDQIRQGVTLQEMYDYVFSLTYLSPNYSLQWGGKSLEQLSPGERGNLLLIFYLLVDQDDIPLIIDQPEENLDNHTVYKTLVPCIKDAKKRRQIIIVTHNPNLAVVCDAEQIICADIAKDGDSAVSYTSGSIEHSLINRRVVEVLEGTRPAFDKRDDKYIP